ncbi:MAG: tetratricopeptide repeat protein [Bacteroidota bacterium]
MAKSPKKKKGTKKPNSVSPKVKTSTSIPLLNNSKLHCWLLLAFSFVLYANTLFHDYTQDDAIVIYDNMYTQQGIKGIPGILQYDTFKGFFKVEGKDKLVSGGRYRPFTLILFAIEWQIFKKPKRDAKGKVVENEKGEIVYEGRPFIGHLINILLYGLTAIALYVLLLKLLGGASVKDNYPYFIAFLTALLFLAHPLHTEAVANIKGRDEIMTLLGSLAAAYFSIRAFLEKDQRLQLLVVLCFFIALLSKENAITFLAVVPLMYYFFTKATWGQIAKQLLPFVGVTALFLMIRGAVLGWSLGAPSMELMNNPFLKIVGNQYVPFTGGEKMATIFYTLGKYIQLLILPHPLTHDYYPRHIDLMSWGDWRVLLSLLAYLALGAYAVWGLLRKDPLSFGILFYLITLSIVSNIVFPVGTNMSERFMFMPSVGFCLILSILAWRLIKRLNGKQSIVTLKQMTTVLGIAAVALVLLSAKTIHRNFAWKDNYTLFLTDIETSPNSAKLRNAVGGELSSQALKKGNEGQKVKLLSEAEVHLKEALKIHPNYKNTHLLLGNCYNYLQRYEESIKFYQKVLDFDSNDKNAYGNLGITYRDAGKYYGEKGEMAKATNYLQKAYEIRGEEYEILRLLGVASGVQGQHNKAIEYFQKCVDLQPKNAQAHLNLSTAYQYVGNEAKAIQYKQSAQQLDPKIK